MSTPSLWQLLKKVSFLMWAIVFLTGNVALGSDRLTTKSLSREKEESQILQHLREKMAVHGPGVPTVSVGSKSSSEPTSATLAIPQMNGKSPLLVVRRTRTQGANWGPDSDILPFILALWDDGKFLLSNDLKDGGYPYSVGTLTDFSDHDEIVQNVLSLDSPLACEPFSLSSALQMAIRVDSHGIYHRAYLDVLLYYATLENRDVSLPDHWKEGQYCLDEVARPLVSLVLLAEASREGETREP